MKNFDTLSETINDLNKRGFIYNFNLRSDCIYCVEKQACINPDEFEILEFYRFEGMSDPNDNDIVYAIESNKHDVKGVLVDAYGVYSDPLSYSLINKFKMAREKLSSVPNER